MIRPHARRGTAPGVIHSPIPLASSAPRPRPSLSVMRLPHPRGLAASLLGAAVLASSACSTTPPPATTPTAGASTQVPIPTATPTATASAASSAPYDVLANLPPDAKEHTVKGAEAFARYFFEAASTINMNPNPGTLSKMCTSDFEFCQAREKNTSWLAAKKYRSSGREHEVLDVVGFMDPPQPQPQIIVTVGLTQNSTRLLDAEGRDLGKWTTQGVVGVNLTLIWTKAGWMAHRAVPAT